MTEDSMDLPGRLTRLEAVIAHLERVVDELNGVVTGHSRRIERLERRLEQMEHSAAAEEIERIRGRNAPPPHSAGR